MEKTSVLTPLVPEPLVTSASFWYELPTLSLTETVVVAGSIATVTKTVLLAATVAAWVNDEMLVESLFNVPMVVGVIAAIMVTLRAPDDATFPAASVAFAVMLCVPELRALVVIE